MNALLMGATWDDVVSWLPDLWTGFIISLQVTFFSLLLGMPAGLLLALGVADADDARGDVEAALVGADLPDIDFATLAFQLVGQVFVLLLERELQRSRAFAARRHIDGGYCRHLPRTTFFDTVPFLDTGY